MFIITKSGYTEITENVAETMMDISMRNRGKKPSDCEYSVESSPERYKVTNFGLSAKTDEELAADNIISNNEYKTIKNAETLKKREVEYVRTNRLFIEATYERSEEKMEYWRREVDAVKQNLPLLKD